MTTLGGPVPETEGSAQASCAARKKRTRNTAANSGKKTSDKPGEIISPLKSAI